MNSNFNPKILVGLFLILGIFFSGIIPSTASAQEKYSAAEEECSSKDRESIILMDELQKQLANENGLLGGPGSNLQSCLSNAGDIYDTGIWLCGFMPIGSGVCIENWNNWLVRKVASCNAMYPGGF